jgi:hypothetical protein
MLGKSRAQCVYILRVSSGSTEYSVLAESRLTRDYACHLLAGGVIDFRRIIQRFPSRTEVDMHELAKRMVLEAAT